MMEALGIILLAVFALALLSVITISIELSKTRQCIGCDREFLPEKREMIRELIDGHFRSKCDKCEWAVPTKR